MAAITVAAAGAAMTMAAASGGGDTVTGGTRAGGWGPQKVLIVTVGATPTTITVDGTASPSVTSGTIAIPLSGGVYNNRSIAVTYNQVTSVTVGASEI